MRLPVILLSTLALVAACSYQVPRPVVSFNSHPSSMQALDGFVLQPAIELATLIRNGERAVELSFLNNQDTEVQIDSVHVRPDGQHGECALFLTNRIRVPAETTARIPLVSVAEIEKCAGRSAPMVGNRELTSISNGRRAPGTEFRDMRVEVDFRARELANPNGWNWHTSEDFYFWYAQP